MFDHLCQEYTSKNINALVSWWMMASYAYYVEDDPIISDETFDKICIDIEEYWDLITHKHKHFIDYECIKSGYYIKEYPLHTIGALTQLRKEGV